MSDRKEKTENLLESLAPNQFFHLEDEISESRFKVLNNIKKIQMQNEMNQKPKVNLLKQIFNSKKLLSGLSLATLSITAIGTFSYMHINKKSIINNNEANINPVEMKISQENKKDVTYYAALEKKLEEQYKISKEDLDLAFQGKLTQDEYYAILEQVDNSKVIYQKTEQIYYQSPNVNVDSEGASFYNSLQTETPIINEVWSFLNHRKIIEKQNNQLRFINIITPEYDFNYSSTNPKAQKITYSDNKYEKQTIYLGNYQTDFLDMIVEMSKYKDDTDTPDWVTYNLESVETVTDGRVFKFERKFDGSDPKYLAESKECIEKLSTLNKPTKTCFLNATSDTFMHLVIKLKISNDNSIQIINSQTLNKSGAVTDENRLVESKKLEFSKDLFNHNEAKDIEVEEQVLKRCTIPYRSRSPYEKVENTVSEDTYCPVE